MAVRNRVFLLLTAIVLLSGCSKPVGDYRFVSVQTARLEGGRFEFEADYDDTTAYYTTAIAARTIASRLDGRALTFDIQCTAPDGTHSIERIRFQLQEGPGVRLIPGSGSVVDCQWPWQNDFRVQAAQAGKWTIRITPTDTTQLDALYGLGFSYTGKHGKR